MSNITASPTFSTIPPAQLAQYLDQFAKSVISVVNGKLDFGNFNFQFVNVTFSTANVATTFSHGLGRTPQGYIRCAGTVGYVYDQGSAYFTSKNITLLGNIAGSATVILF